MNRLQKSRVTVDFYMNERDLLEVLCEQDVRPPQEQLRWLVLNEAQRRGVANSERDNAGAQATKPSTGIATANR